jgi:hypothetical protein
VKVWSGLTRNGKLATFFAVVAVVSGAWTWYGYGATFSAWLAGVPQAIRANTEATKGLERAPRRQSRRSRSPARRM